MGNRLSLLEPLSVARHDTALTRLVALTLTLACACAPQPAKPSPLAQRLPPMPVENLAGEPMQIDRIVQGRVALVSLWATWCDGCQREIEALNRLGEATSSRHDMVVIGVAVGEPRATIAEFARSRGLRYMQLIDAKFAFADALGERHVPATLVVDRSGRIVYRGNALDAEGLSALRVAIAAGDH
jgi:peroxiredoxin